MNRLRLGFVQTNPMFGEKEKKSKNSHKSKTIDFWQSVYREELKGLRKIARRKGVGIG